MIDPQLIAAYNLARSGQITSVQIWVIINNYFIIGRIISEKEDAQRRAAKRLGESMGDAIAINEKVNQMVSKARQQMGSTDAPEFLQLVDGDISSNGVTIGNPPDFRVNPDQISAWAILA